MSSLTLIAYRRSSSGIATYTYELSKALSSIFEVTLPALGISEKLKKDLESRGVKVIDLGRDPVELGYIGGPIVEYMLLSRLVKKALEKNRIRTKVNIYTIPGLALSFINNNNIFLFANAWEFTGLLHYIDLRVRYLPLRLKGPAVVATVEYWLMNYNVFKRAERIFTLTSASFHHLSRKFGDKVVYVPPPIEPVRVERDSCEKLRILFVSRDLSIPRKNLVTLLRAVSSMKRHYLKRMKLVLVGSNSKRFAQWFEYLRRRGVEIETPGYIGKAEMKRVYAKADVLVYPSYYEELGYAVLEAMAHGLPVIASDIPSFRDMVLEGRNGFLIDPKDYRALANRLIALANDESLRVRMGTESLRIVMEKFNPQLTVQKIKEIIRME